MSRAQLSGVNLAGAKFGGAYLYLTEIDGADLSGAAGLKQDQVNIACGSAQTKLPPGLEQPKSWPCKDDDE